LSASIKKVWIINIILLISHSTSWNITNRATHYMDLSGHHNRQRKGKLRETGGRKTEGLKLCSHDYDSLVAENPPWFGRSRRINAWL